MKLVLLSCLLMPLMAHVMGQSGPAPKRLLVVSGGGARGAWGVGIANFLDSTGKRYAHVVGTSTGSLMAPLILLRRFDELNRAYTSTTQAAIFNINPFKKDGSIRLLNAIWRINKPSLGTTENLRNLIRKFVSPDDYQQILNSPQGFDFTVSLVNLRTLEAAYQSARQNDYERMVNWIWASANEPVFMSPYIVERPDGTADFWVDGGVRNPIAIRQGLLIALDKGYEAVDVVVNGPPVGDEPNATWPDGRGTVFKTLTRTISTFGAGTREMNIAIGRLLNRLSQLQPSAVPETASLATEVASPEPGLVLTFYFMPDDLFRLLPNELLFDPALMTKLLEAGKRGQYVRQPTIATDTPTDRRSDGSFAFKLSRSAVRQLVDELNR